MLLSHCFCFAFLTCGALCSYWFCFCLNMYTLVVFLSFYPCSAPLALFVVCSFLPLVRSVHIVFRFIFVLFCFCCCFHLTFVVLRSYCWCSLTFYYIDIVCVFVSLSWTCSVHIVLYFRLDS